MQKSGKIIWVLLVSTILLSFVQDSDAQEDNWLQVDVVTIVPDRYEEYIELQQDEVTPALQRAGVPWRSVWRVAEFGNSYDLQLVTPLASLAQYDSGGSLARVMKPDRRRRLVEQLRRATVSRRRYAMRYRRELSVEANEVGGFPLARTTTLQIAPGRTVIWERFLRESLPRFANAGLIFGVYERVFGPGPSAWLIVENYESFGHLEQPSLLVRAFGTEAGILATSMADVISSLERTVWRFDAELSYSANPSNNR